MLAQLKAAQAKKLEENESKLKATADQSKSKTQQLALLKSFQQKVMKELETHSTKELEQINVKILGLTEKVEATKGK